MIGDNLADLLNSNNRDFIRIGRLHGLMAFDESGHFPCCYRDNTQSVFREKWEFNLEVNINANS